MFTLVAASVFLLVIIGSCFRILTPFEGGVILTLGKFTRLASPGLNFMLPLGIERLIAVHTCLQTLEIEKQDIMTKDNVSARVDAVANYKVVDPKKAILDVEDIECTIDQFAQVALRKTIGAHSLDELISQQEQLNEHLKASISEEVAKWGVQVERVEIRSLDLDPSIIRAMAAEAEAERGRRARLVTAKGELEAAEVLRKAADELANSPNAMALRTLATLKDIGSEQNSIIIFPVAQETMMTPSQTASTALAAAMHHATSATQVKG